MAETWTADEVLARHDLSDLMGAHRGAVAVRLRWQEQELAALRADRDMAVDAERRTQLQMVEDAKEREALRARVAELEEAGRAVLACNDKVCGLPERCFKHCEADAMLRAAMQAGPSAASVHTTVSMKED